MTHAENIQLDKNHAAMVGAYIEAMQWATTDGNDNYLDQYELSEEARQAAVIACSRFLAAHGKDLEVVRGMFLDYGYEQAGHDLFLTRERHGAGFWDRNLGHYGDVFTKYCEGIRECEPYVGDDQLIYMGE